MSRYLLTLILVLGVTACGGGNSASIRMLADTMSGSSPLVGIEITTRGNNANALLKFDASNNFLVTETEGTWSHLNQKLSVLTASNGRTGDINDYSYTSISPASYQYVQAYTLALTNGAEYYRAVLGIPATEIPSGQNAPTVEYTGVAYGKHFAFNGAQTIVGIDTCPSSDCSSTVTANFATNLVNVEIITQAINVGTVNVAGMTISGNGFSDGTITTTGPTTESTTYTGGDSYAQGYFYGPTSGSVDGVSVPAEVGGVIASRSDPILISIDTLGHAFYFIFLAKDPVAS